MIGSVKKLKDLKYEISENPIMVFQSLGVVGRFLAILKESRFLYLHFYAKFFSNISMQQDQA